MVDVIGETFTKKYYFVKASDCLVKNCLHFIASFMKCPGEYFFGLVVRMILLMNIIFLILKYSNQRTFQLSFSLFSHI